MKISRQDAEELGACCADFYGHPLVVKLLDGIFHPGGLALSNLMAERMEVGPTSKVLDIACGDGTTAAYLSKKFSCFVVGIDAGPEMVKSAIDRAKQMGVDTRTLFKVGYATNIPFGALEFSAAYSECAVCTFHEKERAVREILRILQPGGMLGINDITVHDHDRLGPELSGLIGQLACVAGSLSTDGYIQLFERCGFALVTSSSHTSLLDQMVDSAYGRARMMTGLEKELKSTRVEDILRIIQLIKSQVSTGNLGYEMFIFRKL